MNRFLANLDNERLKYDISVIYRLEEDVLVLTLTRTGTHSDLPE